MHPQSIVHSLVELSDGSVIAQLGVTDMRLPIQYAFSWPDRWDGALAVADLVDCRRLEFEPPDHARFPCLALAYRALEAGEAFPVVLNAANEVAVEAFLRGAAPFPAIPAAIAAALDEAAQRGWGTPRVWPPSERSTRGRARILEWIKPCPCEGTAVPCPTGKSRTSSAECRLGFRQVRARPAVP